MKIAIIGTRGIPNHYGGFEQLAEYLSAGLSEKGHEMWVYNSHKHPYQQDTWNKVRIIHCQDPEEKFGTAGQFIYDLNCIVDSRKRNFDVLLVLGYTSFSLWGWLLPARTVSIINMDGLEWKRTKYSKPVQRFLLYAERLAIRFCDRYIADSLAIQTYLKGKYKVDSAYIAYGAEIFHNEDEGLLQEFAVVKDGYYMVMARMEPENNIEMIADGFAASDSTKKLLIVGNTANAFGRALVQKFEKDPRILFTGAIYNAQKVHTLKIFSRCYFHGHSVGGTNPSLLEAMASRALVAANDNPFNRAILGEDALYFANSGDVRLIVEAGSGERPHTGDQQGGSRSATEKQQIASNFQKIVDHFGWDRIIDQYESFLRKCYQEFRN